MLHDSVNCKYKEIIAEHNILVVFADFCNQTVQYAIEWSFNARIQYAI
jgi:hypothetical protein